MNWPTVKTLIGAVISRSVLSCSVQGIITMKVYIPCRCMGSKLIFQYQGNLYLIHFDKICMEPMLIIKARVIKLLNI